MDKQKKALATKYQVRLSENANENIDEIISYISFINHQPLNAIRVGDAIFSRINKIESNPLSFIACSLIPTETNQYRQTLCLSWYIIYKIAATEIIILGIIHKSQKPSKRKSLKDID